MIRILLADDHALVRKSVVDCLTLMADEDGKALQVVEAASFHEVTEHLRGEPGFDLILLDLCMPGMDGFASLELLHENWPGIRVAIISGSITREDIVGALEHGAVGFIPKSIDPRSIPGAIRLMLSGERYLPSVMLDWCGSRTEPEVPPVPGLTPRETEVWQHLKEGLSNKEIARLMGLKEITIKVHVSKLYRRLGVKNRSQATGMFLKFVSASA